MNDPDGFMAARRVAIFGLGLMGGSLALALGGRVARLLAVDPDPATQSLALERQIVDQIVTDPREVLSQVDVIILAAPVKAIIEHIHLLGELARDGQYQAGVHGGERTIILDLGSTKRDIVAAMETLPDSFDPLGGHPMCGKETSGLAYAEADIFRGATFAFTPLEHTSPQGRAFAEGLAAVVNATPLWIDPVTHDHWVAFTSHLPYLLANALAGVTPLEAAPLVGPGFRSASRLATGGTKSLAVMLDILETNQQPLLEALNLYQNQVEEIKKCLVAGDFERLSDLLSTAGQRHSTLVQF
jgi:prephenate dehydrogenase